MCMLISWYEKNMKNHFKQTSTVIALILLSGLLAAQPATIIKVKDTSISRIINNIRSIQHYSLKNVTVTVMEVSNETGSAKTADVEEVTDNLYLGIIEGDEYPKQNLFCIKNLYAISNIQIGRTTSGDDALITFSYIDIRNVKTPIKRDVKIKLTLESATVIK